MENHKKKINKYKIYIKKYKVKEIKKMKHKITGTTKKKLEEILDRILLEPLKLGETQLKEQISSNVSSKKGRQTIKKAIIDQRFALKRDLLEILPFSNGHDQNPTPPHSIQKLHSELLQKDLIIEKLTVTLEDLKKQLQNFL